MFAPVALYELFSLLFHRLRFLTFGLFLWCCFFIAEIFGRKLSFSEAAVKVPKLESFANLKAVKKGNLAYFSSIQLAS